MCLSFESLFEAFHHNSIDKILLLFQKEVDKGPDTFR